MNDFSYLLIGGDKRQEYLFNLLSNKNKKVDTIFTNNNFDKLESLNKINTADIIILPIPSTTDGTTLYAPNVNKKIELNAITERISNNTILFTGGDNNLFTASKAKKVINLLSDEVVTVKNAMATAEAAIAIAIENTDQTLFGCDILIMGYGRIGKILADYLLALKSTVTVCARSEIARANAELSGAKTIGFDKLKDLLHNYKIIINTVPTLLLKKEELEKINPNALIIDLASKPGGIDFISAKKLGLNTIHALSLPGKFSPQSAAAYIEEAINRTII